MIKTEELDPNFKYEIASMPGGERIKYCFNCTGCTVSCPVNEIDREFNPRKILRQSLLGMRKEVLSSELIWLCSSCYACYEHCPQDVRITEIMGALRTIAEKEAHRGNIAVPCDKRKFDSAFTGSIKKHGRVYEAMTIAGFIFRTKGIGGMLAYTPMGLAMLRKGKLPLLPHGIKGKKQVKAIFEMMHR
ncbi:MAG TPA: 4Fe-4S dicluster domain-containing protein [Candidatus Methanoperedenaceae archaeon]|nr:4Fe-4S dicluster domain-containing protein [Candidatus Methanoperedenaceae archaeon]